MGVKAQEFYVQNRSHYFSADIPWHKKSEGEREKGWMTALRVCMTLFFSLQKMC